jgi:hypothetical protein
VVPWVVFDRCRVWVGGYVCDCVSASHCCVGCCVLYLLHVDVLHCLAGMSLICCIGI